MEKFRSKSLRDERAQMESYYGGPGPTSMEGIRSYSVNYAGFSQPTQLGKEMKLKKVKSNVGSSSRSSWTMNDSELQRKKRVATYKAYAMEGKMKGSLRKRFRWIKDAYSQVIYGWK